MIEEDGVHGLAYLIITTEGKRQVTDTTAGLCVWQMLLDPLHRTNEVDTVGLVFLQTRGYRQDIHIEDDVLRRESDVGQQPVGTLGNGRLTLVVGGLALLVEGHHHHSSPQPAQFACFLNEGLFAVLQADGVDDTLALCVLQTRQDGVPVRRVNHQHRTADGRVVGDVAGEGLHLLTTVQHGVVHIDVDDRCATFYLLAGHGHGFFIFLFGYQTGKLARAGYIGALADIDKVLCLAVDEQRLQT